MFHILFRKLGPPSLMNHLQVVPTQDAIGLKDWDDHWETDVIRGKMTRSTGVLLANVCDELKTAFSEAVPTEGAGTWVHSGIAPR